WDITDRKPTGADALAVEDVERLWADLAEGPVQAHRAVGALTLHPRQAVPFIEDRLRPGPALDSERVRRLIPHLGSVTFAVRARASEELARLELTALPLLRDALADAPALEVRRRLEQLVAGAEDPGCSSERLRPLRALRCLEQSGTPEARALLESL